MITLNGKEWAKVEWLFKKFGYNHLFNEMRLGLYTRMNEKEWFDVFHVVRSLSHFKTQNMKTFTIEDFERRRKAF